MLEGGLCLGGFVGGVEEVNLHGQRAGLFCAGFDSSGG